MAEALFDLEAILISRKDDLTIDEAKLLNSWKHDAIRDFGIGATGAGLATWLVTRRLHNLLRVNLAAGVGLFYGFRRFGKSLNADVEHILSQHGTRMQTELGDIMLKKYQHDPQVLQRVSKYFYSENVYEDDSSDQPKPRWRFRNFYAENFDSGGTTGDGDSYSTKTHLEKTGARKTNLEHKQIKTSAVAAAALETVDDPFDSIFGPPASVEGSHRPDTSSTPPRRRKHSHRRSHRRHRTGHQESVDD